MIDSSNHAYHEVLHQLEKRGSYETTAKSRDISKLSGIKQLLAELGEPHTSGKVIHIAGTSGKGLTGAMLARILQQDGFRTGFYSSPHLVDIRERIRLDGQWISQACFARHGLRVLEKADAIAEHVYLSYFDILTAIAFLAFEDAHTEWVVLETGLGGKADSTNVADKVMSILTPIGYDHLNVLGTTLEAIAQEKLGIVRQGVPTVLASQTEALMPWLTEALQHRDSPVIRADQLSIERKQGAYQIQWPDGRVDLLALSKQAGSIPYLDCLKTALMAYQTLFPSPPESPQRRGWIQAAASVKLPGRLEYQENVLWQPALPPFAAMVFDGGHNVLAVEALGQQLQTWKIENYTLVLGFAEDKLIDPLKPALRDLCRHAHHIVVTQSQSPRAASLQTLSDFILSACETLNPLPRIEPIQTVPNVLEHVHHRHPFPVVISGSFYLLGEIFHTFGCEACIFREA